MSNCEEQDTPFEECKDDRRPLKNSKWNLYKNSIRFVNLNKASKSQEKLDEDFFKNRRRCGSLGDVSKLTLEEGTTEDQEK